MSEMKTPSYYAILTADVRYHERLSDSEKLLFAELTALSSKYGYATASNAYLAKLFHTSERTISRRISNLAAEGFVKIELEREGNKMVQRKIFVITDPTKRSETVDQDDDKALDRKDNDKFGNDKTVIEPVDKIVNDKNGNDKSVVYSNTSSFSNTRNTSNTRTDKQTDKPKTQQNKKTCMSVSPSYGLLVDFFEQNIRPVTPYLAEELAYLLDEYVDADLIIEAFKIAIQRNATNPLKFAEGVLRNWRNEKVTTYQQALNAKKKAGRDTNASITNNNRTHAKQPTTTDGPFYTDEQGRLQMREV